MGRGAKSRRKARKLREQQNQGSEWVIDIKECLRSGQCYYDSGSSWTIYRVPRNMREVQRMAYIPKIISIGPFHYRYQGLRAMEEHKMRYLLRLLGCESQGNEDGNSKGILELEELEMAMRQLEKQTRECYSESFGIRSNDFVKMMVVDGCFLVELLRLYYKFDKDEIVDDPIFTTRWMLRTLQRDLSMLENQLPFFVLQKLFKLTSTSEEPSLPELIVTFFDPLLPRTDCISKLNPKEEYDHMLDVFLSTFLSSVRGKVTKSDWKQLQPTNSLSLVHERQLIHSCTELQEAGLKFCKKNGQDLLDISFKTRVLEIPTLYIDDNTVPLFLNFVAYEQCDEDAPPYFTNYFMFFDSLINSSDDVEILHKNGIINHVLGSNKDVANLFNKLCREIVYDLDDCYLSKQMKDVNNYCKAYYAKKWHVWLTNLKNDYFSSPWTFLSLVAAIVLLLLTAAQTFYTLYQYYNQRK